MPEKQQRGTNPVSVKAVVSYLSVHPGSTVNEIVAGTHLSRNTVLGVVGRLAEPDTSTWPRRWHLKFIPKRPKAVKATTVPLTQTWGKWIQASQSWPNAIAKLSRSTDPREIATALESLSANASALAVSFRAVQDEPDWLERIGG